MYVCDFAVFAKQPSISVLFATLLQIAIKSQINNIGRLYRVITIEYFSFTCNNYKKW